MLGRAAMANINKGDWLRGSCDRCGCSSINFRCSIFNTQMICSDCIEKEMKHPLYQKAKQAEREECLKGNLNYDGIGLPDDLAV